MRSSVLMGAVLTKKGAVHAKKRASVLKRPSVVNRAALTKKRVRSAQDREQEENTASDWELDFW